MNNKMYSFVKKTIDQESYKIYPEFDEKFCIKMCIKKKKKEK